MTEIVEELEELEDTEFEGSVGETETSPVIDESKEVPVMELTYTTIAWVGQDMEILHVVDLKVGDEFYGTQIIPAKSALGAKIVNYLVANDIVIPIESVNVEDETEITDDQLFVIIQENVQNLLDALARQKNYDDVFTCISYINSTVPSFKAEARKLLDYRDQCWVICYDLLNKYSAGEIERPTLEDVMNALPKFEW